MRRDDKRDTAIPIPVNLSLSNTPQSWLAVSHNRALGSLYQGKDLRGLPKKNVSKIR